MNNSEFFIHKVLGIWCLPALHVCIFDPRRGIMVSVVSPAGFFQIYSKTTGDTRNGNVKKGNSGLKV